MNLPITQFTKKEIAQEIGDIHPNMIKPYWANGKWSTHELLSYLLSITGPAELLISTFSIGEIAISTLYSLVKSEKITKLEILIDYTAKKHRLELLNFASNLGANIRIASNHSKLLLIRNQEWTITVVGSGNMTPNPRYEAGVIFTHADVFEQYHGIISDIYKNSPSWI